MGTRHRRNGAGCLIRSPSCLFGVTLIAIAFCVLGVDFALLRDTSGGSAKRVLSETTDSQSSTEVSLPQKEADKQEEDEDSETQEVKEEELKTEEVETAENTEEDVDDYKGKECVVVPRLLKPEDVDAAEPVGEIPDHIKEFDAKGIKLPRYPASKIKMVSVTSNNTYQRRVAQENTFGRIFDIQFVGYEDFPLCVLCEAESFDIDCHCPSFRRECDRRIFWGRDVGWWCATRRQILAVKVALEQWTEPELPQWIHLLDDNTFINPIGEIMLINNLDPEIPYFIGDDFSGFIAGGSGKLMSRGLLKKLMGPAVNPVVTYHWQNGTHTVEAEMQLEACLARWQGGEWCYEHGDWGLAHCIQEVGVSVTDLGGAAHGGFFSQIIEECCDNGFNRFSMRHRWVGDLMFRSQSIAIHVHEDQMFDIFYNITVPFYEQLNSWF